MLRSTKAFTFIEILLVIGILSVIGLTIFTTFNRGLQIWQKVNEELIEEDVNVLFEKLTHDLRNTFLFSGIGFTGTPGKVCFPALVRGRGALREAESVGVVEYLFDNGDNAIYRNESNFGALYKNEMSGKKLLVEGVTALHLRYYYYDKKKEDFIWTERWPHGEPLEPAQEILPLAVKIIVEQNNEENDPRMFMRTVYIPRGWWGAWRGKKEAD